MYPKADIPVVQISVNPYLSAKEQLKIGQSIQGLGEENILVIGSELSMFSILMAKLITISKYSKERG